jgi:8-oxo-dGTP pyrophosphatase MutT (NUDIX family)
VTVPWQLERFRQRIVLPSRRLVLPWRPRWERESSLGEVAPELCARLPPVPVQRGSTNAAVLVALGEVNEHLCVLLTRRAATLREHAGEVAFPGGRAVAHETLTETALRESFEEVGLPPTDVEVVGTLGLGFTRRARSTFEIVVGVVRDAVELRASPGEVDAVAWVPLKLLADPGRAVCELWFDPRGGWFRMWFFDLGEDLLWGASARVVALLLQVLGAT